MFTIKNIVLFYFISYAASIIAGFIAGKTTRIKVTVLRDVITCLYDPFTVALKKRFHTNYADDIKKRKRLKLFTLIFLNNLVLAAFITRTLYGVVFFYPWVLTVFGAFSQGAGLARIGAFNPLLMLEFVAYLIAASAGTYSGAGILRGILMHEPVIPVLINAMLLYKWVVGILLFHTAVEVGFITSVQIPEDKGIDMNKVREEMRKRIDGQL